MSYMRPPNGATGYGGAGANGTLGRFDFDASSRDGSEDERSRSRGRVGQGTLRPHQGGDRVHGMAQVERRNANRRSGDFADANGRSRSRNGASYGPAGGQVEDILRFIEQQWSFMGSDTCIPVKVALQLMDSSSLGLAEQSDQFKAVHDQLQSALKVIVNQHHQAFNSSIGTFHKIQAAIHASQLRVRSLRSGLVQAKTSLATARPELKAFATSSQSYDQMLHILSSIEHLQLIPENLEAQISEKRFLSAVDTLQEASKLIRKPEMEEIGALSDLRVYLSNQEHSLTDILIEELHNHLYLKSPYCEERWKAHMKRDGASARISEQERAMYQFLDSYDGSEHMQEDPARNPEADTFYYIQLLVESLNKMLRLEVAVDAIEHRLPVELFTVVERSHMEVEQRHPLLLRSAARAQSQWKVAGLKAGFETERQATLEDLLVTLYAKYEAIAEGHRVLHDVVGAIIKREGYEEAASLNRSFRELWKLLQSEIRSLLHDHLATDGNVSTRTRQETAPSANVFRTQPRDRTRKIFKLAEADEKSTDLATEREDLEFILKASVPGLVGNNAQNVKQDRKTVADVSATGHKLLVEPSVFNMGILLKPSLDFLQRLRDVVPPNSGVVHNTLTSFLDDFLINVFYPQLEFTLLDLCSRSMTEMDAYQTDPRWHLHAQKPIFKGTTRFYELIEAFCTMLDALPHDQSFSQLIITQIRTYYDRCYQWSKSLLQRAQLAQEGTPKMRLAAELATSGQINALTTQILHASSATPRSPSSPPPPTASLDDLTAQESTLLISLLQSRRLEEADLINDRKALAALCTLQVSMKWLATKCAHLRYISPRAIDTSNLQTHQARRWTLNTHLDSTPPHAYLPLDAQTAEVFDAVLASFSELAAQLLRTIHIDLRLHLLHGLHAAMDATYALGQPYNDPDPAILTLAAKLGTYDAALATHLLAPQHLFAAAPLAALANPALIALAHLAPLRAVDPYGAARLQLNILVLQQTLKTALHQDSATLEPAARFYGLAELGPEAILRAAADPHAIPFATHDDLRVLLRLCWPEASLEARLGLSLDEALARIP